MRSYCKEYILWSLPHPPMVLIEPLLLIYKDDFRIEWPTKVVMPLKKWTK